MISVSLVVGGSVGFVAGLFPVAPELLDVLDKRASVAGMMIGLVGLGLSAAALRGRANPASLPADPEPGVAAGGGAGEFGPLSAVVGRDVHGVVVTGDQASVTVVGSGPGLPPVVSVSAGGVVGLPRRPSMVFVGRGDDLEALERALDQGPGVGVVAHAVVGLGGIGKSELVLHYADRHRGSYGLVWWIDADGGEEAIQAGLDGLCRGLCAPVAARAAAEASVGEAAGWALAWLSAHRRWLVIFDNVEDPGQVEPYLGRLGGGQVLITSRRATGWPGGTVLTLGVLEPTAAVELLREVVPDVRWDERAATALAEELDGLPLALTHAGAYIAQTPGMDLARYLRLLRLTPGDGEWAGSAEQAVSRTWAVTMTRIAAQDPLAERLLQLLASYAPDQLPCPVLYELPEGEAAVGEALGVLASYSMLTPSHEGRSVSVHRLVQAVTRTGLPDTEHHALTAQAAALLEAAMPGTPTDIVSWPAYARLLPHARTVMAPDSDAMNQVLDYLDASGDYRTALALAQQRLDALTDRLGPDDPDTLAGRHNLARWTGQAGDAAAARDQFTTLLPTLERVWGSDHPHTLASQHELASWAGQAGDAAAARDRYAALLLIDERVLRPDHPHTLTARHELARWTGEAGNAAAARDQFAALLPTFERVQGPDHPATLTARHNLARWTGEAGNAAAARDQFAALLPIRERVQGPDHPHTLTSRHNLAHWTGQAGDAAAARDQLTTLLPTLERVQGPDHPHTLTARRNLARWTGQADDHRT